MNIYKSNSVKGHQASPAAAHSRDAVKVNNMGAAIQSYPDGGTYRSIGSRTGHLKKSQKVKHRPPVLKDTKAKWNCTTCQQMNGDSVTKQQLMITINMWKDATKELCQKKFEKNWYLGCGILASINKHETDHKTPESMNDEELNDYREWLKDNYDQIKALKVDENGGLILD